MGGGGKSQPIYTPPPLPEEPQSPAEDEEAKKNMERARKQQELKMRQRKRATLGTGAAGIESEARVSKKTLG